MSIQQPTIPHSTFPFDLFPFTPIADTHPLFTYNSKEREIPHADVVVQDNGVVVLIIVTSSIDGRAKYLVDEIVKQLNNHSDRVLGYGTPLSGEFVLEPNECSILVHPFTPIERSDEWYAMAEQVLALD